MKLPSSIDIYGSQNDSKMQTRRSTGRYLFMDVLRVLAFSVIILYHFGKELVIRGISDITDPDIVMSFGRAHLVMIAVGMFFLISGAGLGIKYGRCDITDSEVLRSYYLGRFRQILIPFYIVYAVYAPIKLISTRGSVFFDVPKWRILFTALGMDEYISMTGTRTFSLGIGEWFLGALVLMYLLFPLILICLKKKPVPAMVAGLIYYVVIVLSYERLRALLPGTIGSHYASVPWYMDFFIKICEFSLGVFMGINLESVKRHPWLIMSAGLALLPVHPAFINTAIVAALFLTGLQTEALLSRLPASLSAAVTHTASISYFIYLVHHIVIYAFGDLLSGKILLSSGAVCVLFLVELSIMTASAMLLRRISGWISGKISGN